MIASGIYLQAVEIPARYYTKYSFALRLPEILEKGCCNTQKADSVSAILPAIALRYGFVTKVCEASIQLTCWGMWKVFLEKAWCMRVYVCMSLTRKLLRRSPQQKRRRSRSFCMDTLGNLSTIFVQDCLLPLSDRQKGHLHWLWKHPLLQLLHDYTRRPYSRGCRARIYWNQVPHARMAVGCTLWGRRENRLVEGVLCVNTRTRFVQDGDGCVPLLVPDLV